MQECVFCRFFSSTTFDKGTLSQLKHLIHRTAVGPNPKHNMKPTEDFLFLVLCAHAVVAAKCCKEPNDDVISTADKVIARFVKISISTESDHTFMNDSA